MLRDLIQAECEALLQRRRFGRLAVRDAEGAYIVPLSFAFADGCVYAHAAPGRKIALMRRWPHVAFQVDEIKDAAHWRSVLLRGKFEELHHEDDRERARLLLLKAFEGNPMSVTAGHGHRTHLADAVIFRIVVEEMTGRAEGV